MSDATTTRWSLILAARGAGRSAHAALAQLCAAYRPVVLAHFQRLDPGANADDHTQSFFVHFLEQRLPDRADAAPGSFRAFLYAAARNHWRQSWRSENARKRDAGLADAGALDSIAGPGPDPEHEFDRDWALHVIHRARERLKEGVARSGRTKLFAAVQGYLLEPPEASDYVRIGAALGMPANTVAVAVRRLRERLRQLVRSELADTLPPGTDLDAELQWLRQALRG
ncbi:MAG: sigma-70 family RNA polymerase sigma factor [Proteobacteria bacterium]|nr:sigma-70 family RNA polymerase sigma factor [Pseudomonadota bacterium]MBS0464041.1 sigma-70 family RNA polymerase sigma factor [Pseudomonadota bacterium]